MHLNKIFFLFLSCILITIVLPVNGFCELKALDDNGLSDIYATGFTDFAINNLGGGISETYAWFNINTYQYTEIESLKLGYHDEYDYKDPNPGFAWDEDWENVVFGSDFEDPSQDFRTEGVYFSAEFENIDDPTTRQLKSITWGANDAYGELSADFISYSGYIDNSDNNTPEYNGHGLNLGAQTITAGDFNSDSDASEFSITLSLDGFDKGYWVTFTEATVTPQ